MFTAAPAKSPGWSGVNVFEVVTLWISPAGKRSSGTTLRSGSGLGSRAPFSDDVVYRSPRPRTNTYLPSCTLTPLTRPTAAAASLSGLFEICSLVTVLMIAAALRCRSSAALTEPRSCVAVTVAVASCTVAGTIAMFCSTV
ncbi:MAG: hypothetical protein U5K74_13545 [Gemmatimonadaceae bacterium]|nr:hypothetical protein [Gemmatimonadaceae bacterium]